MRHCRWLDIDKDNEYEILYHPGKMNVVPDALSHKSFGSLVGDMCIRISIDSPLLDLIRGEQKKVIKKEN